MQIQVTSIEGNGQKLDGGAMFGNAPKAVWSRWIAPDDIGRIPLACRSLLVEIDGKKILCETGIGAFFEDKMADRFGVQTPDRHVLRDNLLKHNINPEEIDMVILSHLHFDHAGGLLPTFKEMQAGDDGLIFKNAEIVTSKQAYERAQHPHPRDRASFIPGLLEKINKHKVTLIDQEHPVSLFDGAIEFIFSDGHTPGQMLTLVKGPHWQIIFTGDLVPGTHWVHVPITMGYDRFPEMLIDEKTQMYKNLNLDSTYFFYTHDHEYCCSKIQKDEKGKFTPVEKKQTLEHMDL